MDVETAADCFVGIDVSKARIDVHVRPDGTTFFSATDAEGLAALVRQITSTSTSFGLRDAYNRLFRL